MDKSNYLADLIDKYNKFKSIEGETGIKKISESNIRKDFIDPLFEILDWQVRDYHEYDAENYVRGAGFVDIALKVSAKVVVYIEAKKFGGVPSRHVVQDLFL